MQARTLYSRERKKEHPLRCFFLFSCPGHYTERTKDKKMRPVLAMRRAQTLFIDVSCSILRLDPLRIAQPNLEFSFLDTHFKGFLYQFPPLPSRRISPSRSPTCTGVQLDGLRVVKCITTT
uniref:Uncharacterized protein n=1 Tax=Rhipicephalus appendiculatus TaxID=34631 RepID=A0A131YEB1_RHIAP